MFKEKTRDVLGAVPPLQGEKALKRYFSGKPVRAETPSGALEVPLSAFDLELNPHEGYEVAEKGGVFVAIRKERDSALIAEGLVRDLARRLQALRKEKGFVPTAMLDSASIAGMEAEDLQLLEPRKKEIAFLVRVRRVDLRKEKESAKGWAESDLDGRPIYLKVG
jgi:isoleucyl-tRNA synthetase